MPESILYLFPDTNVFVQCYPLEELDWSEWTAFDAIHLIVSAPVLREIDSQKKRGNDRLGRRARGTSKMLREIIVSGQQFRLVRKSSPSVKLFVSREYDYDKSLVDRLNFEHPDDQLVGAVFACAQRNPEMDVRLLTHDTMPLITARSLELTTVIVPDQWLLPPESTDAEKRMAALEAENSRLRKAEPAFQIRCLDSQGQDTERYETTLALFQPLTESELESLILRLKEIFPLTSDFGPREPKERDTPAIMGFRVPGSRQVFVPATDEEINTYKNKAYPQWLERCDKIFRNLHTTAQPDSPVLTFSFAAYNVGSRPAKDALVTIEAKGDFRIFPPKKNDDGKKPNKRKVAPASVELPPPPKPPHGNWKTVFVSPPDRIAASHSQSLQSFAALDAIAAMNRSALGLDRHTDTFMSHLRPMDSHFPNIDPNTFYYKGGRPVILQTQFSLECLQWRHGDDEELFTGEIHFSADQDIVEGALELRIQAENLSQPATKRIPVRRKIERVTVIEAANQLIDRLVAHSTG